MCCAANIGLLLLTSPSPSASWTTPQIDERRNFVFNPLRQSLQATLRASGLGLVAAAGEC